MDLTYLGIGKIENLPNKIDGHLIMQFNNIRKIENIPKNINGSIDLNKNPIKEFDLIQGYFNLIFYNNNAQTMQQYYGYIREYNKKRNLKRLYRL